MEIKRYNTLPLQMVTPVEKPFFAIKKSALKNFKEQVSQKGKQVISALYDNVAQMRNEDSDYGHLPRLKKQLIDLSHSPLMDNEVDDILAYNEELNNGAIV